MKMNILDLLRAAEEGKYFRKLRVCKDIPVSQYSKMITEYINAFDTAIKAYLNCGDKISAQKSVALVYNNHIVKSNITI